MSIVFKESDKQTGVQTQVHDLDNKVVIEKSYDAQPFIEHAAEMRAATDGEKWGEFRYVGTVPMAELATMLRQDGTLDQKRAMAWLKANPQMVAFSKLLK